MKYKEKLYLYSLSCNETFPHAKIQDHWLLRYADSKEEEKDEEHGKNVESTFWDITHVLHHKTTNFLYTGYFSNILHLDIQLKVKKEQNPYLWFSMRQDHSNPYIHSTTVLCDFAWHTWYFNVTICGQTLYKTSPTKGIRTSSLAGHSRSTFQAKYCFYRWSADPPQNICLLQCSFTRHMCNFFWYTPLHMHLKRPLQKEKHCDRETYKT